MADRKLSAPKFSSFKSKPPAAASAPKHHDQDEASSRQPHRRHSKHRHQVPREPNHGPDAKHTARRAAAASVPGLFVIDKKGDALIRKYGPDRAKVPPYYRWGRGRVLGTKARLVVHRDGPAEEFSLVFPGDAAPRQRDGLRTRGGKEKSVRLRASATAVEEDPGDYIALENPKKKRRVWQEDGVSDGDEGPSWRSIEGKAKPVEESDASDSDASSSADAVTEADGSNALKWKHIQLNRRVKEQPADVDGWLELVDLQDALLRQDTTSDVRATESARHSYTEIKVHMLESALAHASEPRDRQRILVPLMYHGVRIWSREVAAKKWLQVADDERDNFALWKVHVDFAMSSISTFDYQAIKKMLVDRLRLTVARTGLEAEQDAEEAVHVFLRATRFMQDAGYGEVAVAAWQGLLEMNFFAPKCTGDGSVAMAAFRDFWESEVPRIGEANAQGWRHFVDNGGEAPEPLPAASMQQAQASKNAYRTWASGEEERAARAKMPARTMDAGTDDDPFRIVTFDDIAPLLFHQPKMSRLLIDAFFIFCQISAPIFADCAYMQTASTDPFVATADIHSPPAAPQHLPDAPRKPPNMSSANLCARVSQSLLFDASWFRCINNAVAGVDAAWVDATLRQLVYAAGEADLAGLYLGVCVARGTGGTRRLGKALLGSFSTEARLYAAYACAELASGNEEMAEKVLFSAAQSASLSLGPNGPILFSTWAWLELQRGSKTAAVKRLCAAVDASMRTSLQTNQDAVSPALVLKAQQFFSSNAEAQLYQGHEDEASMNIECLVLLSYLTDEGGTEPASATQGNISAAMDTIKSRSNTLCTHRRCYELVLQSAARLLYWHSTKGPFRRIHLREQFSFFIDAFPQNTMFLRLFAWADTGIRVIDETRQLLHDKVFVAKASVTSHAFAIEHELERGRVHAAQGAFEQALMGEASSCATLWRSYLRFCQAHVSEASGGRQVAFRALKHCPWAKGVALDAIKTMADEAEAKIIYDAMAAKGLRIHTDLE
ncbi:hypothetical protein CDD81_4135 [Ophiocordyceps australis]|uniref:DUF1740-domain-containing protein n=1 Tax=Ophiocordyceps australis TaxID=1399860 RepID=A0A2C5YCK7_9HYPO|nr:hypothetical protein CDD81_4135 [Ophiocordyceps australis]